MLKLSLVLAATSLFAKTMVREQGNIRERLAYLGRGLFGVYHVSLRHQNRHTLAAVFFV